MPALRIDVDWRAGAIAAVGLRADLPKASQVLTGRTPDEALALLGRLYAVCGRAQRAAAELALCAAGGPTLDASRRAALEESVAREAVVEHLWRLLVDWPRKLGIAGAPERFAHWYRGLATPQVPWADLERELADAWLAAPLARLVDWDALDAYDAWCDSSAAALARLLGAVRAADPCDVAIDARAAVAETGAIDQHAEQPWIAALLRSGRGLEARVAARLVAVAGLVAALLRSGRGLEARVAARLVAVAGLVAALASPSDAAPEVDLDATSPAERCGRAAVQTARGMLVHDVRLEAGRIVSYAIHTPTERNFAEDGAYRVLLARRQAPSAAAAQRLADLWALALDPCVPYAVHVAGMTEETGRA